MGCVCNWIKKIGMAFGTIRLIARYERRLITRSKLFWIFAICVLVGITGFQWLWQGGGQWGFSSWSEVALPSFFPYLNAWLYSLVQGIMVIFIGIDFIRRDRRLETNVVFLARPVIQYGVSSRARCWVFWRCVC